MVRARRRRGLAGLLADGRHGLLVALFFFVHYMFASLTAHTTAVLPVDAGGGPGVPGMPLRTFALLLGFSLGIMGVITPYATGPAPVYFASGFIARRDFWRLGLDLRSDLSRSAAGDRRALAHDAGRLRSARGQRSPHLAPRRYLR